MYVLSVGMVRSASTWQYNVACRLLENRGAAPRLGFFADARAFVRLRQADAGWWPHLRRALARLRRGAVAGWRALKAHDGHPAYEDALRGGQALGLYVSRDLRDVAFSLMHKCAATFEQVTRPGGHLNVAMSNHAFWTAQPGMLRQRYETILADPAGGVAEIAGHLGLTLAAGEAAAVAEEYSLKANMWRAVELANRLRREGVDLELPANALRSDEQTLLHWNHIREGLVGGWRAQATPAQAARLAEVCGRWLVTHGYETGLTWAAHRAPCPAAP
jgi:hypothetical protein